jgi:hypothetical protein
MFELQKLATLLDTKGNKILQNFKMCIKFSCCLHASGLWLNTIPSLWKCGKIILKVKLCKVHCPKVVGCVKLIFGHCIFAISRISSHVVQICQRVEGCLHIWFCWSYQNVCLDFMKFTMIMNVSFRMKILMNSIYPFDWKT